MHVMAKTEERLVKVSTEAAQAQAQATAARAAVRQTTEEASASAREAALRRDELVRMRMELKRSQAACAEKVRTHVFVFVQKVCHGWPCFRCYM